MFDQSSPSVAQRVSVGLVGVGLLVYAFWTGFVSDASATASQVSPDRYTTKKIEDIQVGDRVLAFDERTGEWGSKPVVNVFRHHSHHLRILKIQSLETGEVQTIQTTDEHPFWVHNAGWSPAKALSPGTELTDSDGHASVVLASAYESHPEGVPVFNFEVEDWHTYHVKAGGTRGPPLVVHNTCTIGEITALQRIKTRNSTEAAQALHRRINGRVTVDLYGSLSARKDIPGQAHHLNQDAAFRSVIRRNDGVSVKLEGNAFTDIGSPHYNAHANLEGFWNQFRRGGNRAGDIPTNLEYSRALLDSLQAGGLTRPQALTAVRASIRQRIGVGQLGGVEVPRVPGRINQVR